MGYKHTLYNKKSSSSTKKPFKTNLQTYYSTLYDQVVTTLKNQGHEQTQIDKCLLSIFSRTKIPTKTNDSRLLALLDVDKIISINERSLKESSEEVKQMRMIASLRHQRRQQDNEVTNPNNRGGLRAIDDLVRLARLHMLQNNRQNRRQEENNDDDENDTELNPQIQRFQQLRMQRLRNSLNRE